MNILLMSYATTRLLCNVFLFSTVFLIILINILYIYFFKKFCKFYSQKKFIEAEKLGLFFVKIPTFLIWHKQNVYMYLSIMYFEQDNKTQFNNFLNKISHKDIVFIRYYYYILNQLIEYNNLEDAKKVYKLFLESSSTQSSNYVVLSNILKGIFEFYNGNFEISKFILNENLDKISIVKVKEYCKSLIILSKEL